MPLASWMAPTDTPYRRAILLRVSPACTVYLTGWGAGVAVAVAVALRAGVESECVGGVMMRLRVGS